MAAWGAGGRDLALDRHACCDPGRIHVPFVRNIGMNFVHDELKCAPTDDDATRAIALRFVWRATSIDRGQLDVACPRLPRRKMVLSRAADPSSLSSAWMG
jgi:hypothetical protein